MNHETDKPSNDSEQVDTDKKTEPISTESKAPDANKNNNTVPSNRKETKKTITLSAEELKKWTEQVSSLKASLKQKEEELKKAQKNFEYEKEGYVDRNKNLQNLLDSAKNKYDKSRKKSVNLEFKNEELNKEVKKIEEEMGFYKLEVKEKFNLELKLASMDEEIQSLRKLRDKFNSENLAIINTELKTSNENYKKQNEHLNSTIEKLESDSKRYIKLLDERDKKIKHLQADILKLEARNRELLNVKDTLEEQITESNEKNAEISNMLDILKTKSRKETKILRREIDNAKEENKNLIERNDKLKVELDKLIQNLRRTPVSGVELNNNGDSGESRQEKIILETLVFKNRELENELRGYRKEKDKIKVISESLAEKLEHKQAALEEAVNFIYSDQYLKASGINKKDFMDKDLKRIENARINKSLEEMRDLLEKLLTENIQIKKANKG